MISEKAKSAEIEYPVHELIRNRRSRRAYANRPVEPEKIKSLFEAARWAPSSMNEQPWVYIYANRDEQPGLWQKVFATLAEGNQVWAKNAPLLIVSITRTTFLRNDQENRSARYDTGSANALLSLQATALGLNVHQMGGFDGEVLRKNLNIPHDYELGVVMAIGYLGDAGMLPDNLKEREESPRYRLVQHEFVMNKPFEK